MEFYAFMVDILKLLVIFFTISASFASPISSSLELSSSTCSLMFCPSHDLPYVPNLYYCFLENSHLGHGCACASMRVDLFYYLFECSGVNRFIWWSTITMWSYFLIRSTLRIFLTTSCCVRFNPFNFSSIIFSHDYISLTFSWWSISKEFYFFFTIW